MERECAIKVGMSPHPWDNKDKPYYWVILVNDCNEGSGWSKTPEQAWKDAYDYYETFVKKPSVDKEQLRNEYTKRLDSLIREMNSLGIPVEWCGGISKSIRGATAYKCMDCVLVEG